MPVKQRDIYIYIAQQIVLELRGGKSVMQFLVVCLRLNINKILI